MKTELIKSSHFYKLVPAFVGSLILFTSLAFAESGEAHTHHHSSMADLKWPVINFTLYVIGMFFLLRGIISNGWQSRAKRIREEATRGERELAAANALLSASRERNTKLPAEISALTKTLTAEGQNEAAKALTDAQQRVAEIGKQSKNRIEAEQRASAFRTRIAIAEKVVAATEAKIRSGVSSEDDKRIRAQTAKSLGAMRAA